MVFISKQFAILASFVAVASALPIRREVPQEHSHEQFLRATNTALQLNNPDGIVDAVFGLLGNAAGSKGQGKISDTDCLQQATADRAFTNAKNAKDVNGQVAALIYRAVERNTGKVGLKSVTCTAIKAVNPEIAALQQHQDPASDGAAAQNKAITLELAKQIAAVGGNPLDALKSGTFAPGDLGDNTGKGNTCDDANDATGCIFSGGKLVNDATPDEINAAVKGGAAAPPPPPPPPAQAPPAQQCTPVTVTVTAAAAPTAAAPAPQNNNNNNNAGGNLQTFTGALQFVGVPAVTKGGRGFQVENNDSFVELNAALGRSCDVQHNACANKANTFHQFSVGECDAQNNACRAAIKK